MAAKLKDIAQLAGVSISTVSRVLANDTRRKVNGNTRRRILDIAATLGVEAKAPDSPSPRNPHVKCLGIVYTPTYDAAGDPFFAGVTAGIQMQAPTLGYTIGFRFSHLGDSLDEIQASLASAPLDGVVLLGRFSDAFLETILHANPNVVYAGLNSVEFRCAEVIGDARWAIRMGVGHLAALGYRRIGYIGPHLHQHGAQVINEHRYTAFCNALKDLNLPLDKTWIRLTGTGIKDGHSAMLDLIDKNELPRAIQCGCDEVAIGAINAARKRGVRIPEDVAIVGVEDIAESRYLHPALTTVHVPALDIGAWAVNLLDHLIGGRLSSPAKLELPLRLAVRESCGAKQRDE